MNIKLTHRALMVSLLVALTSGIAHADELLPRVHYEDQLARCVAEIRVELAVSKDQPLQHHVIEIDKGTNWYSFTIETLADSKLATTECRSWRFEDRTVADVDPVLVQPQQLAGRQ
jgi:hypothetical protein